MSWEVRLSTSMRRHVAGYDALAGLVVEYHEAWTVGDLLDHLGVPRTELKIAMVDGRQATADTPLPDGARVGLFPPVGGG